MKRKKIDLDRASEQIRDQLLANEVLPPISAKEAREIARMSGFKKQFSVGGAVKCARSRRYHSHVTRQLWDLENILVDAFGLTRVDLDRSHKILAKVEAHYQEKWEDSRLSDNWISGLIYLYPKLLAYGRVFEASQLVQQLSALMFVEKIRESIEAKGLMVGYQPDSCSVVGMPVYFFNKK